jgi:cell division protein FtsQ
MDPRIRQRRIAVRRDEGRRRLRVLIVLIGMAVLIAGGIALTRSPVLAVRHVEVTGATKTGETAVLTAAHLQHGGRQMIDVEAGAIERKLEALPWVAHASVQRHWPQTVRIVVTERAPVAAVADQKGWAMLDGEGRVLDVSPAIPKGMLTLVDVPPAGPPGSDVGPAVQSVLTVAATLPADVVAHTVAFGLGDGGQLQLHLKGGGVAFLGSADDVPAKVLALQTVLARVDLHSVATIDVRVPGAPVVTRQGTLTQAGTGK